MYRNKIEFAGEVTEISNQYPKVVITIKNIGKVDTFIDAVFYGEESDKIKRGDNVFVDGYLYNETKLIPGGIQITKTKIIVKSFEII